MMCEACLKVVNVIDNTNSRDLDSVIRDVKRLHENFEIWLSMNMNIFPDKEESTLIDSYNRAFMLEYYGLAKRVFNIAHDEEPLMYEGTNINNVMLRDADIKKEEIFHTLYAVIEWIGGFQEKKRGSGVYDKNASYKIMDRLKKRFLPIN